VDTDGSSEVEWLEAQRFLIYTTHYDHPDFPDALSLIGDTDGPQMHYFDTRGMYRVVRCDRGRRRLGDRDKPAPGPLLLTAHDLYVRAGGSENDSKGATVRDGKSWDDDLEITYRRVS
jgi:hypothetical protein